MKTRRQIKTAAIDLNLLPPLLALLTERHITNAALRCDVSQPVMSRILDRLRIVMDDELLIRNGGSYSLTPRAVQLRSQLVDLLPQIDRLVSHDTFDPKRSHEHFRVISPEYGSIMILPTVMTQIRREAPQTRVEVAPWRDGAFEAVAAGDYDLAIAPLDGAKNLELATLLSDEFVCVVDANHPLSGGCDLDSYLAYSHVVLSVSNGQQPWIDRPLRVLGRARRVAYCTSSVSAAVLALVGTDLIFTASRRWWSKFAHPQLRAISAPPQFDAFIFGMAWHRRLDAHPAHSWFRQQILVAAAIAAKPGTSDIR